MEKAKKHSKLSRFFEQRPVMAVSGLLSLGLAYMFVSWAIDSGSLFDYTLALLSLFFGIREVLVAIFGKRNI